MVSEPIKYTNQCQQQLHEKKGSSEIKKKSEIVYNIENKIAKRILIIFSEVG